MSSPSRKTDVARPVPTTAGISIFACHHGTVAEDAAGVDDNRNGRCKQRRPRRRGGLGHQHVAEVVGMRSVLCCMLTVWRCEFHGCGGCHVATRVGGHATLLSPPNEDFWWAMVNGSPISDKCIVAMAGMRRWPSCASRPGVPAPHRAVGDTTDAPRDDGVPVDPGRSSDTRTLSLRRSIPRRSSIRAGRASPRDARRSRLIRPSTRPGAACCCRSSVRRACSRWNVPLANSPLHCSTRC